MRADRVQNIEEELADISRILHFKEKSLLQHEVSKNYCLCEQVTEEMMTLKSKRHELEAEKAIFMKKERRAKARARKKCAIVTSDDGSDVATCSRSSTSRSATPQLNSSSLHSLASSPVSPILGPSTSLSSPTPDLGSSSLCSPLSPSHSGSRINPVDCGSESEAEADRSHF